MHGTALETRGEITATAYDTSGTRMATCTSSGAIHVWDRAADAPDGSPGVWRQTSAWAAHDAPCLAVAFADAEHGQCLASSDGSGAVRVWREPPRSADPKAALAASRAALAGAAPWDLCADLGAARRDASSAARHLAFAPPDAAPGPNGTRAPSLAAAGDDGVVRFYAPRDADALADWELENEAEALAPGGACTALAWRVAAGESSGAGAGAGARDGALTTPKPAMLAVGMHWPATGRSDARVLARDEANARWRVAARLFSGEPRAPATALAWAPDTDAFGGGTETIAAAVGAEVGVFRVEAFPGGREARGAATYDEEGPAEKAAAEKAAASGATFSDGGGGAFRRGGARDAEAGELRARCAATLAHPAEVHGLDWNVVGNALATSAGDGRVRVWAANVQTGAWEERAQLVAE